MKLAEELYDIEGLIEEIKTIIDLSEEKRAIGEEVQKTFVLDFISESTTEKQAGQVASFFGLSPTDIDPSVSEDVNVVEWFNTDPYAWDSLLLFSDTTAEAINSELEKLGLDEYGFVYFGFVDQKFALIFELA